MQAQRRAVLHFVASLGGGTDVRAAQVDSRSDTSPSTRSQCNAASVYAPNSGRTTAKGLGGLHYARDASGRGTGARRKIRKGRFLPAGRCLNRRLESGQSAGAFAAAHSTIVSTSASISGSSVR